MNLVKINHMNEADPISIKSFTNLVDCIHAELNWILESHLNLPQYQFKYTDEFLLRLELTPNDTWF